MKVTLSFLCAFALAAFVVPAQQLLKGKIVDKDSITPLPFVYVINKASGNGTMSDQEGRFTLTGNPDDTLICTYVGYAKLLIPVRSLMRDSKGEVKVVMNRMLIQLKPVTVAVMRIKPYERDYMKDVIDDSRIRKLDYLSSPVTALYMQFSREGKQLRKLAKIFEQIFIEEEVGKKLNPEILRKLTGDEKIDYQAFRKYCVEANDQFIITHEGVELYSRVMDCYKRWKSEGR